MTDILIIGGGVAGLTAALYAARAGKAVTVCEKESFGGQITQSPQVDNYPGLPGVSGLELGDRLYTQAAEAGADILFSTVESLENTGSGFCARTDSGILEARAVIFAGGSRPRPLGVARETQLVGRGVSYCALCDGGFFRGKDVAVVGGGNAAFTDARFLANICRSVTLIHRRNGFRAEQVQVDALRTMDNVRILTPCTVTALLGDKQVEGLTVRNTETGQEEIVLASGVFAAIGHVPDCSLVSGMVSLAEDGSALAGEDCTTATPGLFIAGDCRKKAVLQLTTAVADGTVAAVRACEYLEHSGT